MYLFIKCFFLSYIYIYLSKDHYHCYEYMGRNLQHKDITNLIEISKSLFFKIKYKLINKIKKNELKSYCFRERK